MFGATVTLVDEDTDEKAKYRIVGEVEANVKQGKISITSPLARALLGKRKKDVVEVSTPGGGRAFRRAHMRGDQNVLKRLFVHAGAFNLGLQDADALRCRQLAGPPRP